MSYEITTDKDIVGPWVARRAPCLYDPNGCVTFGLLKNGTPVSGALFTNYRVNSIEVNIAIEGKNSLNRAFLKSIFKYAFNQLKVNKILGYVNSYNEKARRFDEHIGFTLEYIIKDAGKDGDLMLYSMTKEQCRWL